MEKPKLKPKKRENKKDDLEAFKIQIGKIFEERKKNFGSNDRQIKEANAQDLLLEDALMYERLKSFLLDEISKEELGLKEYRINVHENTNSAREEFLMIVNEMVFASEIAKKEEEQIIASENEDKK